MQAAMPPMLPICRSSTTRSGSSCVHGGEHVDALADPEDLDVVAGEGGVDLVVDPVGVGGEQHAWHGGTLASDPPGSVASTGGRSGPSVASEGLGTIGGPRIPPDRSTCVLEIQVDDTVTYTLCRPVGELDAYTVASSARRWASWPSQPRVLIDLSEVPVHGLGRPRRAHRRHPPGPRARRRGGGGLQPAHPHPPAAHHRASTASSRSPRRSRRP